MKRKIAVAAVGLAALMSVAGIKLDPTVNGRPTRTIEGTYYPYVYNGDFEDGDEGWHLHGGPRIADEFGNGNGLIFDMSSQAWTEVDVKPGVENELLFYCRCTHGSQYVFQRRTFYVIWIGDDGERINKAVYTPYNRNEYENGNDGWGISPVSFNPTSSHGRIYVTGDCLKFKIVYVGGRYMF